MEFIILTILKSIAIGYIVVHIPDMYRAAKEMYNNRMVSICFRCASFWCALLIFHNFWCAAWCAIIVHVIEAQMDIRL